MRTVIAHCITQVNSIQTQYGLKVVAEMQLLGEEKKKFWMSEKQGQKLSECFDWLQQHGGYSTKHAECHIVLDQGEKSERFVWCGIHTAKKSDLDFLESRFGVKCESPYIGRAEPATGEAADHLKDE
jgi:hypothetical protein